MIVSYCLKFQVDNNNPFIAAFTDFDVTNSGSIPLKGRILASLFQGLFDGMPSWGNYLAMASLYAEGSIKPSFGAIRDPNPSGDPMPLYLEYVGYTFDSLVENLILSNDFFTQQDIQALSVATPETLQDVLASIGAPEFIFNNEPSTIKFMPCTEDEINNLYRLEQIERHLDAYRLLSDVVPNVTPDLENDGWVRCVEDDDGEAIYFNCECSLGLDFSQLGIVIANPTPQR